MKGFRIAICAVLVFAVLAHGAVESWARAVLETGVGVLLVSWGLWVFLGRRSSIYLSPLLAPLAALAAVGFFQWIFHVTASPYATRIELQLLGADLVLLFLTTQAFRTFEDWKGFIWFVMIFSFVVALFGILQQLTFNGKLYWFRELRYGGIPFGPYVNRNHYAAFAELTVPAALVPLILGKVRHERRFLVGLLAVVPVSALLFCGSRGGVISFACELLALAFWLMVRRAARIQALAGVAVLALAVLAVFGLGAKPILQRFSATQPSEVTASKRAAMARDTFRIFRDHLFLGTGLGTLPLVYPPYETLYDAKVVNHSHNDYLEALAETGLVGGLCCAWFLFVLMSAAWRNLVAGATGRAAPFQLAAVLGCLGFLVHSLVDFNLHIPANALLFLLMAGLGSADVSSDSRIATGQSGVEPVSLIENAD